MIPRRLMNRAFAARGRPDVILWEVLPIHDGERLKIRLASAASPRRQGVWLRTDRGILVGDELCPSLYLWHDTAPPEVVLECRTDDGSLSFYNVWESERGVGSQSFSSGMLVERDVSGLCYFCNDIGLETDFRRLVFHVERCDPA